MVEKNNARLQELSEKWLNGTLTAVEREEFNKWFNATDAEPLPIEQNRAEYRNYLFSRIKQETGILQPKRVSLWPKVAVAAAIATIIFGAGLFYFSKDKAPTEKIATYANDVAPGKIGATLTLGNGQKINLSSAANGRLAKQSGLIITKAANGQLTYSVDDNSAFEGSQTNTLSTTRGETYILALPDGSKVWLNAASSITYTTPFNKSARRAVQIDGEAYFQVAKDKDHPFVVTHGNQQVEVLGTHFNVATYSEEPMVTTLEEGSVKVIAGKESKIIRPGQQAINNGNGLKVQDADLEQTMAWKDGNFIYSGAGIRDIMRQLERWYDIEVIYEGKVSQEVFYANISRFKNISQVLKMLEKTKAVHFSVKGRRITVRE